MSEDSIEFSLSIAEQRAVGFILAWSLAFLHADSIVDQVALLSSNNSLQHSEQYLLYIRSVCSLPTTVRPQSAHFAHCLFQFI